MAQRTLVSDITLSTAVDILGPRQIGQTTLARTVLKIILGPFIWTRNHHRVKREWVKLRYSSKPMQTDWSFWTQFRM